MRLFKRKSTVSSIDLNEAIARGLVRVEIQGVGEGIVSRARFHITKLTDDEFTLRIPRSTEFVPLYRLVPRPRSSNGEV